MSTVRIALFSCYLMIYFTCSNEESSALSLLRPERDDEMEFSGNSSFPLMTHTLPNCPPWFLSSPTKDSSTFSPCYCSNALKDIIQCDDRNMESYMALTYCLTYNESSSMELVGACPYPAIPMNVWGFWVQLPHNISLCKLLNREGLLCGRCMKGYGISVHSNDLACVDCSESPNGWAWFLLTEILLQTLFFLVIFFFRVNVTADRLNGFLLFCQILSSTNVDRIFPLYLGATGNLFAKRLSQFIIVFYKFWVLEFFTSVLPRACFRENLSTLNAVAIGYVSAFYPFFLILFAFILVRLRDCNCTLISIIWKPYQKIKLKLHRYIDLSQSLIHTFSSIIVLSYSKLALVSYSLLFPTDIFNASGVKVYNNRWYHDAEVQLFSPQHIPYGILALVILMTFVITPPLLLFLYPFRWFRWLLRKVRINSPRLNAIMDSFQGCYKNGTNNTRDLRYFSGLYFMLRLLFIGIRLIAAYQWHWNIIIFMLVFASVLISYFRPYRREVYNIVDVVFILLLACEFYLYLVLTTQFNSIGTWFITVVKVAFITISLVPFVYFIFLMVYEGIQSIKATKKFKKWVSVRRHQRTMKNEEGDIPYSEWPERLLQEESVSKL